MFFRAGLLLLTLSCTRPSPLYYDASPLRTKRDNENSSTMATFTVERLDAPIERIEIRLIDENSTSAGLAVGGGPEPLQPAAAAAQGNDARAGSIDQYDVRYKKTRAWLSFSTRTPSDGIDDLDVLPPEAEESGSVSIISTILRHFDIVSEDCDHATNILFQMLHHVDLRTRMIRELNTSCAHDDEYEPVEECLLNRDELPLKTVQRLTEQARKLGKLIRTRNRLQQQYCINREQPQLNDEFRWAIHCRCYRAVSAAAESHE
ncbi:unnamed protein product [Heligmosomoides polygyrus]|uniref:Conserved secreted protein n=1 Tax=Heligmosomoides polygyrus TaxID=6339 RepID=A0A3P8AR16_HELPZ|nr:unnamed protein product [Heligmosomoides polygyrus]